MQSHVTWREKRQTFLLLLFSPAGSFHAVEYKIKVIFGGELC